MQKDAKIKKFLNVTYIDGDLMWQNNIDNKDLTMSKLEAKIYCKELNLATKRDWRLPKYDELLHLVNYSRYKPAVIDGIHHIAINKYWTASENSSDVSATWYVDFKYGETGSDLRYLKHNIRCVRDISKIEGEI